MRATRNKQATVLHSLPIDDTPVIKITRKRRASCRARRSGDYRYIYLLRAAGITLTRRLAVPATRLRRAFMAHSRCSTRPILDVRFQGASG
jgi:hypothetical protein